MGLGCEFLILKNMIGDRDIKKLAFLSAKGETGAGTGYDVSQYRNIVVAVAGDNSANLTVKCRGSVSSAEPSWASAKSVSNQYDEIAMWELQGPTSLSGDTGVVFSGSDDVILYEVNTNGLNWLNFVVTSYTAGDVTVTGVAYNNQ